MEPLYGGVHGAERREAARRRLGRQGGGGAAAEGVDLPDLSQTYVLRVDPGTDIAKLASELQRDPAVDWVEPNYLYQADSLPMLPDDPPGPNRRSNWPA